MEHNLPQMCLAEKDSFLGEREVIGRTVCGEEEADVGQAGGDRRNKNKEVNFYKYDIPEEPAFFFPGTTTT